MRPGVPTDMAAQVEALEREGREFRQANQILKKASAHVAQPRPGGLRLLRLHGRAPPPKTGGRITWEIIDRHRAWRYRPRGVDAGSRRSREGRSIAMQRLATAADDGAAGRRGWP